MRRSLLVAALSLSTVVWADDAATSPALGQALIIENAGQFPAEVRYAIQQGGDTLWITNESLWLSKRGKDGGLNLRIDFEEANPINIRPSGHSSTKVSYFIGDDESQWHPDVPVYTGLKFRNLYDGVDLDIGAENGKLEWRWIVGRGKKVPGRSAIHVSGGDRISETVEGVEIGSAIGDFTLWHPAPYDVDGNRIGGKSNTRNAGTADLIWSTYINFTLFTESSSRAAIDSSGAVYVCVSTNGGTFPVTVGAFQSTPPPGANVVLLKLNPTGTGLIYATYLGGSAIDTANSIQVDGSGNAIVGGMTTSNNFPVLFTAPRKIQEADEGFLIKLNQTGTSLLAATLIGGTLRDEVSQVAITATSKLVAVGTTKSSSLFGVNNPCRTSYVGQLSCGFIAVLNSSATQVEMVSFFGSNHSISIFGIAVDASGNIHAAGSYQSSDSEGSAYSFTAARVSSLDPAMPRFDNQNGFVVTLSPSNVLSACLIGGNSSDVIKAIAINATGGVVAAGFTHSSNFPVTAGVIRQFGIGREGFVMLFNQDCSRLSYSTLIGGPGFDSLTNMALDAGGNVYVAGQTNDGGLVTTADAFSQTMRGASDGFLALLKNNGRTLAYSTYFGGASNDFPLSMAVLPDQTVTILTNTYSADFPGVSPTSFQPALEGFSDLVVTRFRIENPGAINGYAFQDYNQNGTAGPYELPLAGLIIYDDLNNNGVLDSITERSVGSAYLYGYLPGTNIPYMFVPNYGLNNLPVGVHRVCASFAPTVANSSTCKNVTIQFGATTQNVNFGLLPGQVGVSSLTPKTSTVKVGDKLVLELNWAHPENWRKLNEAILRLTDSGSTDSLQIRYLEAPNTFSFYNDDAGKFGPAFPPGAQNALQTNEAKFYLEETAVQGSGPTGKSVKLRLVISFKPKAAGKTLDALFFVSDDNGDIQGYEPLGKIIVIP